jgi:outer membrane protein assembly factor BamB
MAVAAVAAGVAATRDGGPAPAPWFPIIERWAVELAGQPAERPVVIDGFVIVAIGRARVDAFSLADGKSRWSIDVPATALPAAGDGLVFVPTASGLDARDAATGAARWHADVGQLASPPRWRAGWLIAGLADGRLVALRAADGAPIWTRDPGSPAHAIASIEGDRVYVPLEDGRIEVLNIETGEPIWEHRLPEAGSEILALPDRVYVGSLDNDFYCLSARNGTMGWRWRTGADVVGGAAVDASRVYFASLDTVLRALDRRSGVQQWHKELPARPIDAPAIAGAALFTPMIVPRLLFYPLDGRAGEAGIDLPDDLFLASRLDPPVDGGTLLVVTVAPSGRATLRAFGRAPNLAVAPLGAVPGEPLGPAFPLPRTELPVRFLALPEWPPRGG